jgi:hypothetical protein
MNRKILAALLALATLFALACQNAGNNPAGANGVAANGAAANGAANAGPGAGGTTTGSIGGSGAVRDVIAAFPDSKAVGFAYVNRILTQALPAGGMPQSELDRMYADAQREGFDPRSIDLVVAAIRYTEPVSPNTIPEFLIVAKGSFNATDVIEKIKAKATKDAPGRQETYKGKTLEIFSTTHPGATRPEPIPEVAITSFDNGTVVGGVPAYVRSAIDAAEGGPRVRQDIIDLATANSDSLISFAGDVPPSLIELLRSAGGMRSNPDAERAFRAIRQLQLSIGMNATDYTLNTKARTDTPENATWMSSTGTTQLAQLKQLLQTQISQAPPSAPPSQVEQMQLVLNILNSLNVSSSGNEVSVNLSVPISTVRSLVQKETGR